MVASVIPVEVPDPDLTPESATGPGLDFGSGADEGEMPEALRAGWSWGQGVTGAVIATGLALLLFWADDAHQRVGIVLVVAGVVALVAVEWTRVLRRRRAARLLGVTR